MLVSNNDLESTLEQSLLEAEQEETARVQSAIKESMISTDLSHDEQHALKASDLAATEQEELEQQNAISQDVYNPYVNATEWVECAEGFNKTREASLQA